MKKIMQFAISKYKLYDIILGNTIVLDPFKFTEKNIRSNWFTDRKQRLIKLYKSFWTKTLKYKLTPLINEMNREIITNPSREIIYVQNRDAPQGWQKSVVYKNLFRQKYQGHKITTNKNIILHK